MEIAGHRVQARKSTRSRARHARNKPRLAGNKQTIISEKSTTNPFHPQSAAVTNVVPSTPHPDGIIQPKSFMSLEEQQFFDPGPKGEASWECGFLRTADNTFICDGPVRRLFYECVRGVDLVRWFTQMYLEEKATLQKARKKRTEPKTNPLGIPNPQSSFKPEKQQRARKSKRECFSTLLNLPAEIRLQIYSYAIPVSRILILGNQPNKDLADLKSRWENHHKHVKRPSYKLFHVLDQDDIDDGCQISPALLLVSKQINQEVHSLMYKKITFCFESMKVINTFLDRASQEGLKVINKLELNLVGYGEPKKTKDEAFKLRHDQKWSATCDRISDQLPALNSLRLEIAIRDSPITFGHKDRWWKNSVKLLPKRRIRYVKVVLKHPNTSADRLAGVARRLEDRMMDKWGRREQEEREANILIRRYYEAGAQKAVEERARLKLLPLVQAKRVLSITVNEASMVKKEQLKKHYTSKTAGYVREWQYGEPLTL